MVFAARFARLGLRVDIELNCRRGSRKLPPQLLQEGPVGRFLGDAASHPLLVAVSQVEPVSIRSEEEKGALLKEIRGLLVEYRELRQVYVDVGSRRVTLEALADDDLARLAA